MATRVLAETPRLHPDFLSDLDYASRVPKKYLEHSTMRSEGGADRVGWVIFHDFSEFSSILREIMIFLDPAPESVGS